MLKKPTPNPSPAGSPSRSRGITPISEKKKKIPQKRSHSAGTRRVGIRSGPNDDALVFARGIPRVKHPTKKTVLVIHGDPSLPNPILPGGMWDEDDFESVAILKQALQKLNDNYEFRFYSDHTNFIRDLQRMAQQGEVDLVLQLCDEGYMNNGRMELHLTAYLEMIGLPFTGTGPSSLAMTYDKQVVLEVAKSLDIPTPISIIVEKDEEVLNLISKHNMEYPLFVKPNCTDGSYGITTKSICRTQQQVLEAISMIRDTFHVMGPILIQEFLEGSDLNTALIGNGTNITFLPVTEEDYSDLPPESPKILGFEAKWDENSPYFRISTIPAKSVDEQTKQFMLDCTAKLCKRIGLRDYVRLDWKLDSKGRPRFLEANPNCGWSYDAHLQRMCAFAGISYSKMLQFIIEAAFQRLETSASSKRETFVNLYDVSHVRLTEKQTSANARTPMNL